MHEAPAGRPAVQMQLPDVNRAAYVSPCTGALVTLDLLSGSTSKFLVSYALGDRV